MTIIEINVYPESPLRWPIHAMHDAHKYKIKQLDRFLNILLFLPTQYKIKVTIKLLSHNQIALF